MAAGLVIRAVAEHVKAGKIAGLSMTQLLSLLRAELAREQKQQAPADTQNLADSPTDPVQSILAHVTFLEGVILEEHAAGVHRTPQPDERRALTTEGTVNPRGN